MFRICKNSLSQRVPAGTSAPSPAPFAHIASRLHTCGHACDAGRCHRRKRQRERLHQRHVLFLGTLQVTPGGAGQSALCEGGTFEIVARLSQGRSPRPSVTQAQEADASSVRPPCSERHGRPGPLSAAAPSWHACAVAKDSQGSVSRVHGGARLTRTPRWRAVRG